MTVQIKTPILPESVNDAAVATWHKKVGDYVQEGETLVDLETDKIMLEVPATQAGVLTQIIEDTGAVVKSDAPLAEIDETAKEAPQAKEASSVKTAPEVSPTTNAATGTIDMSLSPAVRQLVSEKNVDVSKIKGSGKGGRIVKKDIEDHLAQSGSTQDRSIQPQGPRHDERVPMTRLRASLADRLLTVQQSAAILTTFNEVNMQPIMDLRAKYKKSFEQEHEVKLGFMSFFVKAVTAALKSYPVINATLDGNDVVYHHYADIGIAVASPRGLVVPILRNAEQSSMAEIEQQISAYAGKAKEGKLTMEELTGGTFTITNGGTFGSMMSTPILNPPQSAILGMHNIVKRAVVEADEIVIRPMMYLALSYDHRLIDGAEAVRFLVTVKERLEDPTRLLLEV